MIERRALLITIALAALATAWCGACGVRGSEPPGVTGRALPMIEYPGLGYTTAPHYRFSCSQEVLNAARMYTPSELMVYRVVHRTPTRDLVRDLAERMGVPVSAERYATMPDRMGDEYRATVGQVTPTSLGDLDVLLADDGTHMMTLRSQRPDSDSEEAPSDAEAAAIAEDFVHRSGLLPQSCRLACAKVGQTVTESLPSGGVRQKVLGRAVVYTRYLGGLPDGSLVIRVNGRGKVYSVNSRICTIAPSRSYPILSPEEAVAALISGEGSLRGPWRPPGLWEAVIDTISLRYHQGPAGDTVQPVFDISGTTRRSSERFSAVVPAVRPEYLAHSPPGRPGGGAPGPRARRY